MTLVKHQRKIHVYRNYPINTQSYLIVAYECKKFSKGIGVFMFEIHLEKDQNNRKFK